MFKVKMTLNGRPLQPGDLARTMTQQIERKLPEVAKSHLGSIRCPEHGRGARVRTIGLNRLEVTDFCCERLREEVQKQTS